MSVRESCRESGEEEELNKSTHSPSKDGKINASRTLTMDRPTHPNLPGSEQGGGGGDDEEAVELVLFHANECYVYLVTPQSLIFLHSRLHRVSGSNSHPLCSLCSSIPWGFLHRYRPGRAQHLTGLPSDSRSIIRTQINVDFIHDRGYRANFGAEFLELTAPFAFLYLLGFIL